jgi:hypothetical protein
MIVQTLLPPRDVEVMRSFDVCMYVSECMKPRALNNSKNTVCTLMKFSTNVHINSSKKPINFSNDPLSSS